MRVKIQTIGLITVGTLALAVLGSCSSPFTSRSTITPIYAATSGGLSVFNGSTWTTYTTTNGMTGNTVNAVTIYGSGANAQIYAATSNGVSIYNGTSWSSASGLIGSALTVNSIYLGSSYLYAGTAAGLYVLESSGWAQVAGGSGPGGVAVNDVFEANGTAYVATSSGLYISDLSGSSGFVGPSASTATSPPGSGAVTAVFVDQSGDLFAGTSSGLQILPAGMSTPTWTTIAAPYLPSTTINSIFVDPYLDIFVATAAGLAVSTDGGTKWATYTTANGLGSNTVNQVFVVGNSIYAATNGGLSVSTNLGASWTTYTTSDGLGSNTVNGVFVSAPLYSFGS